MASETREYDVGRDAGSAALSVTRRTVASCGMTDGPRGSRDSGQPPAEGTPEYDWLYGERPGTRATDDRTRVIPTAHGRAASYDDRASARPGGPRETGDRETQVLPTMPTHASSGGSGSRPPAAGRPTTPPPSTPAREVRTRRRFPRFSLRLVLLLVLAYVAFLVGVPLWAYTRIEKVDAAPSGDRPAEGAGTNYLIVGSDKADDLTKAQQKALGTGPRGGTNTDTIIVLHTGAGQDTMMSIPRDTLADIPGVGTGMINSAFARGQAPLLVATVEALTGIHIDHYVELGFGSVINTVDALGGVEICPKIDMVDKLARLDIEKGCQEVDGETALAYSRSRHVTALSDLDRVGRQREVIASLGDKVLSPGTFLNPVRYWRFNNAAADSIRVDEDMGPVDLGRFALAMTGSRKTCTMPNLPAPSDPNRIVVDPDRAQPLFDAIIEGTDIPRASCTSTGRART